MDVVHASHPNTPCGARRLAIYLFESKLIYQRDVYRGDARARIPYADSRSKRPQPLICLPGQGYTDLRYQDEATGRSGG